MNIKEFIKELEKHDPELEVMVSDSEWGTESLNEIREDTFSRWDDGKRYEVKCIVLS